MSHDFRSRLNDYISGNPTSKENQEDQEGNNIEYYDPAVAHKGDICFFLKDGRQLSLEYSYLIAKEYKPEDNSITLSFTSHKVILKGYHLEKLFQDLRLHLPRTIGLTDERYSSIIQDNTTIITDIEIS
ncbi:MAG: hypothetical protein BGO31_16930 [Bacteroidetes bacterium 43-16]|uniref:hypothetical protein n=1 Tax=uncultured Flavobacterium sp. TaxID=165435 RepID=UPI00092BD79B|nr:hypothetical protein [uncultured Flavobacterium sp.]OJV55779.1 MAG: hypothetical protein BGO31_16930 [Bacteroidetes bacterium 43-16]